MKKHIASVGVLGVLLVAGLLSGCASSRKAVSDQTNAGALRDASSEEAMSSDDSLLLARSLFLLALEMENRGVREGVDHLLLRAYRYDPTNRWLGFRALEAMQFVEKSEEFEQTLNQINNTPGEPTLAQHVLLGQLWRHLGNLDSARAALDRGEALDDENVRLLFEKVLVLEGLGKLREMAQTHAKLVRILDYPDELVWKQLYLNTAIKDVALQEAFFRELWGVPTQGDRWGLELLRLVVEQGRFGEGADIALQLLERSPGDEELGNIAISLLQKTERDREAVDLLHKLYAADSSKLNLLDYAGRIEIKLGEFASGVAHLRQVLSANSNNGPAQFFLSMGLAQEGETKPALEAIDAALRIDSNDATFHTQKVLILLAGQRYSEAQQALVVWKKSTADTSTIADLRTTLQITEAHYWDAQPKGRTTADSLRRAALPHLLRVASSKEVRAPRLFDLAITLDELGRFDEARPHFERLIAQEPNHAEALNYYGYSLLVRGEQLQRADTLINRALTLEPDNMAFLDSKAWSFHLQGRHSEALEILDAIEERGGMNHGELYEHKALVLEALGRMSEALNYWKRVVEEYPAHAETLKSIPEELKSIAPAPQSEP